MGFDELEDLLEIVQRSEDMDIDLEATEDSIEIHDVRDQEGFTYPALLVTGILFSDALRVLKTVRYETWKLVDVWVDLNDGNPPVKQGTLPLDSNTLITMHYLGLSATLYGREDFIQPLNLSNPAEIEKYI